MYPGYTSGNPCVFTITITNGIIIDGKTLVEGTRSVIPIIKMKNIGVHYNPVSNRDLFLLQFSQSLCV